MSGRRFLMATERQMAHNNKKHQGDWRIIRFPTEEKKRKNVIKVAKEKEGEKNWT